MSATWGSVFPAPFGRRMGLLSAGLVLFGVSLALLVRADLGLDPWDAFHQGLAETTGIRFGAVVVMVSFVVLLLWVPLRQRAGIGTIANAIVVGVVFEIAIAVVPEMSGTADRWMTLTAGIALNALATSMYIGAGLGPGPRDGLMTGLAARGWPIRSARTSVEVTVLGIGWLLGGSVGLGTVVFAVTIGPLIQVLLPRFRIEPRHSSIQSKNAKETRPCMPTPTS